MAEKDYTQLDAVELAQEPSFTGWVQGTDPAAARFWEDWLAAHPSRAEVVAQARQLVQLLHFEEVKPPAAQVDSLWNRINASIAQAETSSPQPATRLPEAQIRRLGNFRRLIAAAATVAILLVAGYVWNLNRWKTIETGPGQQLTYQLPDKSSVQLNAVSSISYRPARWKNKREIRLSGEAFFDVRKGSPFSVNTEKGRVEVLGTSFNVVGRENQFSVDCFTGRVRVLLFDQQQEELLSPGNGVRLEPQNGKLLPYSLKPEEAASWRRGIVYYNDLPLGEVFRMLERQFDVDIQSSTEIEQREATGFFQLNNLDSALYDVTWPTTLKFKREGKQIRIQEQ